jgi:hypothetical protein
MRITDRVEEMRNADRGLRNEVSRISNSKFGIIMANWVLHSAIRDPHSPFHLIASRNKSVKRSSSASLNVETAMKFRFTAFQVQMRNPLMT